MISRCLICVDVRSNRLVKETRYGVFLATLIGSRLVVNTSVARFEWRCRAGCGATRHFLWRPSTRPSFAFKRPRKLPLPGRHRAPTSCGQGRAGRACARGSRCRSLRNTSSGTARVRLWGGLHGARSLSRVSCRLQACRGFAFRSTAVRRRTTRPVPSAPCA